MAQIFKMIWQKSVNWKIVLLSVVDESFFNEHFTGKEKIKELPEIFETICIKQTPNIYSWTYPNVRISMDDIKDVTKENEGKGISGILTENEWIDWKALDFNDILWFNL